VSNNIGGSEVNVYQNLIQDSSSDSIVFYVGGTAKNINIEDNIILSGDTAVTALHVQTSGNQSFVNPKRIYKRGGSTAYFSGYGSLAVNATTECYSSLDESEVDVANRNIAFDTTNFVSVGESDANYLVPKATSVLYTAATQTTNIPENTIGFNGVTTTRHTVGCMSTPPQILPPTGVTVTQSLSGVVLTWTNTVQSGFEKTFIYYEIANADSLFVTPKASVLSGVTTYTIPYSALVGSERWYVRLAHGA